MRLQKIWTADEMRSVVLHKPVHIDFLPELFSRAFHQKSKRSNQCRTGRLFKRYHKAINCYAQ
jgi:hypothetical protein